MGTKGAVDSCAVDSRDDTAGLGRGGAGMGLVGVVITEDRPAVVGVALVVGVAVSPGVPLLEPDFTDCMYRGSTRMG